MTSISVSLMINISTVQKVFHVMSENITSLWMRNFSNSEMVLSSEEGRVCAVSGGKERSGEV